jgi:hypothetical protein
LQHIDRGVTVDLGRAGLSAGLAQSTSFPEGLSRE